MNDNRKDQYFDKYNSNNDKYISFLLPLQKKSNLASNLGKRIKSLNYFTYISKFG